MAEKKFFVRVGQYEAIITDLIEQLKAERIVPRIWDHDHTVWQPDPTEISHRLGWLHSPKVMVNAIDEIASLVNEVRSEAFTHTLLLGMGGSSLAPEVFRRVFGVKPGYLDLTVLDSTTPGAVLSYARAFNAEKTLFLASTKSGGTVETLSFTKYFYNHVLKELGAEKVGRHFIAITDPGSGLQSLAADLNFRKIFLNDPDIGGRFSALSFFGLVPAGLIGSDLKTLLDRAQVMSRNCSIENDDDNPGVVLGAILSGLAKQGRDKLAFIISPALAAFGDWVEQLVAESTGKQGVGILPVIGEAILKPEDYADDRLFVYLKFKEDGSYDHQVRAISDYGHPVVEIHITEEYDLAGELFRWEMATAIAGYFLKINPFDQPNVEAAKIQARKLVAAYQQAGRLAESQPALRTDGIAVFMADGAKNLEAALASLLARANPTGNGKGRSYVAIQAFIQSTTETDTALHELRTRIQTKYKLATTVGYGPRFLHSTGQLHKGDAGNGLFIQITSDYPEDAGIPDKPGEAGSAMTFGVLALAQALGDRQALLDINRKVVCFHLSQDTVGGIRKLIRAIN